MDKFGLSDAQAQAILEMQLQRLTALERDKIAKEYLELIKRIEYLTSVLESPKKVLQIIKDELKELKSRQGQVSNIIEELIKYKMAYEDIKAQFTELQERYDIAIYKLGYLEARNKELEQQSKGLLTRIKEWGRNK